MKKLCIPAVKITTTISGKAGISVPAAYREYYQDMLAYCLEKRGGYISVTFYPPRKPRSTGEKSQNHHLNGHITQIAQFIGDDFDTVKMHIKRTAIKRGYPTRDTKLGDVVPISEADSTTEECAMLIDTAHEVADFLSLKLYEGETNEVN